MRQSNRMQQWGAIIVSVLIVVGYFVIIWAIFITQKQFNEREATILNQLFGVLTAGFVAVCQYWLGSSAGSAAKDRRLAAAEAAPAPSPSAPSPTDPPPTAPSGRVP